MADFMMSRDAELERDVHNQLFGASTCQFQRTTDPKAVPFWPPKEHICKLQEMVGVLWGGGVLSETWGWDSEKLHKAPGIIFRALQKEKI